MKTLVYVLFAISTLFASAVYADNCTNQPSHNAKYHWVASDGADHVGVHRQA